MRDAWCVVREGLIAGGRWQTKRERRGVKRRTEIILAVAVLAGLAALSSVKRGGRGEAGKCSGGACCPLVPDLNVWPARLPAGTNFADTNSVVMASETVTNGQR